MPWDDRAKAYKVADENAAATLIVITGFSEAGIQASCWDNLW